jgi:hypothetical protein
MCIFNKRTHLIDLKKYIFSCFIPDTYSARAATGPSIGSIIMRSKKLHLEQGTPVLICVIVTPSKCGKI